MSQESLDRTRTKYRKKVKEDKTLLATVIAQLMQNKKILKQAEECARHKALGMANKMVESSELNLTKELDCLAALISIYASPVTQGTIGLIKESVANYGTHAAVPSSS